MQTFIDVALSLDSLCPAAEYVGSVTDNSEESYESLVWLDKREKPSWEEIKSAVPTVSVVQRITELQQQLTANDLASVRPLRAKVAGTATAEDEARLVELEEQAQALRAELAEVSA